MTASDRAPRSRLGILATSRRRALAACVVVALLVHWALVGNIGGLDLGASNERGGAPVSVRTIAAAEPAVAEIASIDSEPAAVEAAVPAPATKRPKARRPREPAGPTPSAVEAIGGAGTRIDEPPVAPAAESAASAAMPTLAVVEAATTATAVAPPMAVEPAVAASAPTFAGDAASLLAPGEEPPPLYRTRLPPSATLRYQVRRSFLRGNGEIRWQSSGESYRLTLEARIAGLTLLIQTSEGGVDAHGLAPVRFLDQRARRPAQAANFRRDIDRITFSGPPVEWPLVPGSQDRLSWMIQLAGIAAAEPGLLVEGGKISMVVVGARGEASVWTLRFAGYEDVETVWGTTHAVKLVREARSISDTGAEIWLDPARDYLPAHATMRNRDGAAEYDLLLERVDPPS